jgi:hypothetical protein
MILMLLIRARFSYHTEMLIRKATMHSGKNSHFCYLNMKFKMHVVRAFSLHLL